MASVKKNIDNGTKLRYGQNQAQKVHLKELKPGSHMDLIFMNGISAVGRSLGILFHIFIILSSEAKKLNNSDLVLLTK